VHFLAEGAIDSQTRTAVRSAALTQAWRVSPGARLIFLDNL